MVYGTIISALTAIIVFILTKNNIFLTVTISVPILVVFIGIEIYRRRELIGQRLRQSSWRSIAGMGVVFAVMLVSFIYGLFAGVLGGISYLILSILCISALASVYLNEKGSFIIIMVLLGIYSLVGMPVMLAWGPIVQSKAEATGTTLSVGENVQAGWQAIVAFFNDTWTALTDPEAWYEKQFVKKGKRENGETSLGVEIEKVKILPEKSYPSLIIDKSTSSDEEASIIFTIENKGDKPSSQIRFGAVLGNLAYKRGARVGEEGRYFGRAYVKTLPSLRPNQMITEDLTLLTPYCDGTYRLKTFLEYEYNVTGLTTIEFIDYDYYLELLKRKKIMPEDRLSVSSAGPFKVTLRTSKLQPIPVENNAVNFTLYVGVVNERNGNAFIKAIYVYLPKNIKPECGWKKVEGKKVESQDGYNVYRVLEPLDLKNGKDRIKIMKESTKRCIQPKDSRYFSCKVQFRGNILQSTEEVVKVKIEYIFRYEKPLTFTVVATPESKKCTEINENIIPKDRQNGTTFESVLKNNCVFSKSLGKNKYLCSVRADKKSIIKVISAIVKYCALKNYGADSVECGDVMLDPLGSKCNQNIVIKRSDINLPEAVGLVSVLFESSQALVLNSSYIYDMEFKYEKGVCNIGGYVKLTMKNKPEKDNYECHLDVGMPCKDNSQCKTGVCASTLNYMLSNRGLDYDTLMKRANRFVTNIIEKHELRLDESLKGEDKCSQSTSNPVNKVCPVYFLWFNPDDKKSDGSYILSQEVRKFIKNVTKVDFDYLNPYKGNYGKILPSNKVCQDSFCTYRYDPNSIVDNGVVGNKGCMCRKPPFYLYDWYKSDGEHERLCLKFCKKDNYTIEYPCLCANPEIYPNSSKTKNIDFLKLSKKVQEIHLGNHILMPTGSKRCETEKDEGNVRKWCCACKDGWKVIEQRCECKNGQCHWSPEDPCKTECSK